jgi:hypothetical protein
MRKIYVAARYDDAPTVRKWEGALIFAGHEVVSSWHRLPPAIDDEERRDRAVLFHKEIAEACTVVVNNDPRYFGSGRGGRHVEFGIALALGKDIWIIGGRENAFHHHPEVKYRNSLEELLCDISP